MTHCKASSLPRSDELDVPGYGILADPTLHPDLPLLVTRLIDGHTSLEVVHTTQYQIDRLTPTRQVAFTGGRN